MTQLVPILHPPTGEILYMHPDLAAQTHHWLHPDPNVPTPPESLPLFDVAEVDRMIRRMVEKRLAHQPERQYARPTPSVLNGSDFGR